MAQRIDRVFFCFLSFISLLALTGCKTKGTSTESSEVKAGASTCPAASPRPGEVPSAQMIREKAKVTGDEINAIHTYTSDTMRSSIIKTILQCTKQEELSNWCMFGTKMVTTAVQFQSGVQKISKTMPYVGVVYRGIVVSKSAAEKMKQLVGKTLGLAEEGKTAYVSSTRDLNFADRWIKTLAEEHKHASFGRSDDPISGVIYMIHQCRGAAIEGIEPAARGANQKEVILPPSRYKFASSRSVGALLYLTLYEADCGGGFGLADANLNDPDANDAAMDATLEQDVLPYIELGDATLPGDGLSLAGCATRAEVDPKARAEGRKVARQVVNAVRDVQKAAQTLENLPQNASAEAVTAAQQVLREKQLAAKAASSGIKELFKVAKFSAGKIIPVVGAAAEVVGLGLGIAEAVDIKKGGGSDAAAAAAVLSGWGLPGAIPAVIACEDCTPDEKAAAFFSGFLGIDFTHLVVCPGKRCPQDDDLARFSGDWSMRRVKRSCPYGHPVTGTVHGGTQLQVICSPMRTTKWVSSYRFIDNGDKESRWHYPLYCNDDEYLAGISFAVTTLYGIKSILCAKPDVPFGGKCQEIRAESCPQNQFMRGIHVDRAYRDKGKMGVFCDRTQRSDDIAEYCDQISLIKCCDLF